MTTFRTITVAASQSVECAFSGSFIVIKDASFSFKLSLNDGEEFQVEGGFTIRRPYRKIKVTNESADESLVVTFYLGQDGVEYQFFKERSTYATCTEYTLTSGGNSGQISGRRSDGSRRRTAILNNLDAAQTVYLCTFNGLPYAIAGPLSSVQIDTDADLWIYNSAGASANVTLAEFWYA